MALQLSLAPDIATLVRAGALGCDIARVVERDDTLDEPLGRAEQAARMSEGFDLGPARHLYRSFGIDPTRTRPSSEALLRRVRRGESLPRINTLVDLGNWCSLEVQLPYGLYDLDRIQPPVELRRGRPGEAYQGIRKDEVHLDGRPTLADGLGPFGNPTSDSSRTMVTTASRRLLVVVFAPATTGTAAMARVLDVTATRFAQYAGGAETWRWVS